MSKRKESHQLQDSLCALITRTSKAIRNYFNQELIKKGHNITLEQFEVLILLWNNDGNNQQRLSQALCKDKTTVTRFIKNLEKLNLAKRVKNKKDERQKLVYLTPSGKKIMKKIIGISQKISMKAQKGIVPEDIVICEGTLRKVHEALSKEIR